VERPTIIGITIRGIAATAMPCLEAGFSAGPIVCLVDLWAEDQVRAASKEVVDQEGQVGNIDLCRTINLCVPKGKNPTASAALVAAALLTFDAFQSLFDQPGDHR
jgi:hypothetical protein